MQIRYYLLWLLALTPWIIRRCSTSDILMVTLAGTKSHKTPFWELAKGLIERNHSIMLLSAFAPDFHLPGLEELAPADLVNYNYEINNRDFLGFRVRGEHPYSVWELISYPNAMCSNFFESSEVQELLKSDRKFDLLIIDSAFPDCAMGLVHYYNVPFMYINTVPFYTLPISFSGSPVPYSVTPFFLKLSTENMDLLERTMNTGCYLAATVIESITNNMFLSRLLRKYLGPTMPSAQELRKNVSFILQNGHPAITYPRPYLPNVAEIACIHCKSAKPLNKELEDFIDKGGDNGFILVSMGGCVKLSGMPVELRKAMVKAFSQLPQQIVWKWENDSKITPEMPPNVMLSRWLPQQDLLGHKKIRAFITHCGIQSLLETVYHGVPVVSMPLFADQDANAMKTQQDGYGIVQDVYHLTSRSLLKAINEVVHNPKYREEAKRRQFLLKDQKETPVERAVYWTEYVLKHKGAKHLMSPSRNMNVIQYYSVDSVVILMVAALFVIFALGWLLKISLGCILALLYTPPTKEKTKGE